MMGNLTHRSVNDFSLKTFSFQEHSVPEAMQKSPIQNYTFFNKLNFAKEQSVSSG